MAQNLWSRGVALAAALVIALATIYGLRLVGVPLPLALLLGWLLSSTACLLIGAWRRKADWAVPGFLLLGGGLVVALAGLGITSWWWPLGLIALGVVYVPLIPILPGRLAAGWRAALELSTPLVVAVGAAWALGQVITVFILASQNIPLLAGDANAMRKSFVLSSLLLVAWSLLWALLRQRLLFLALTALLLAQLGVALVVGGTEIGNPNAEALFALALLVAALACHVGTYVLRFSRPELAPANAPGHWHLLVQRRGRLRASLALKALRSQETWGLCFLLDCSALLLTALALVPVIDQPTAESPNSVPLVIVLVAGALLSAAVAYWQQAPWLVLLGGLFLAGAIYTLGLFAMTPASTWPLLYFAATTGCLGLAIWLRSSSGHAWARPCLVAALGAGCLALTFALQHRSVAWGVGMALALSIAALLAVWGWRLARDAYQHS